MHTNGRTPTVHVNDLAELYARIAEADVSSVSGQVFHGAEDNA